MRQVAHARQRGGGNVGRVERGQARVEAPRDGGDRGVCGRVAQQPLDRTKDDSRRVGVARRARVAAAFDAGEGAGVDEGEVGRDKREGRRVGRHAPFFLAVGPDERGLGDGQLGEPVRGARVAFHDSGGGAGQASGVPNAHARRPPPLVGPHERGRHALPFSAAGGQADSGGCRERRRRKRGHRGRRRGLARACLAPLGHDAGGGRQGSVRPGFPVDGPIPAAHGELEDSAAVARVDVERPHVALAPRCHGSDRRVPAAQGRGGADDDDGVAERNALGDTKRDGCSRSGGRRGGRFGPGRRQGRH